MSFRTIVVTPATTFSQILEQLDARTLVVRQSSPVGVFAAPVPGVFCYDETGGTLYFAKETDGTVLGTTWVTYPESTSAQDLLNPPVGKFVNAVLAKAMQDEKADGEFNHLLNGDFQYATYGSSLQPLADRYVLPGVHAHRGVHGGMVFTVSAPPIVTPANNYANILRIARVSGSTNFSGVTLEFALSKKQLRYLRGKEVTIFAEVRISAANTVLDSLVNLSGVTSTVEVTQLHSASPYATFASLGQASQAISGTDFTTLSTTGLIPNDTRNVSVMLGVDYLGSAFENDYLEVGRVGLVLGRNRVPPAVYRETYDEVSARAQCSFPPGVTPAQNAGVSGAEYGVCSSTGALEHYVRFPRPMAKVPTVTLYNPLAANASVYNITDSTNIAVSIVNVSTVGFRVYAGANAVNANDTYTFHYLTQAELT